MIKKHYTGNARRALNMIWNAAERYDFDPPFMAFYPNGKADPYFNMVLGFTAKYFDLPKVEQFFGSYEKSSKADEFDEFLWLGIESCVYQKEVKERPVLENLRKARAEEFFTVMPSLSRQQMMLSSLPVFNQQEARWAKVLGKKEPVLTPHEKKMKEALEFPENLDTDGLIYIMSSFLQEFFHYDVSSRKKEEKKRGALKTVWAKLFFKREENRRDVLFLRTGNQIGDITGSVELEHFSSGLNHHKPDEKDAEYIQEVFGPCLYHEKEMRIMENDLCRDNHAWCRLWFAKPSDLKNESNNKEAEEIRNKRIHQHYLNAEYRKEKGRLINGQIQHLSGELDTIFESYLRFLPEVSDAGRIQADKAWRMKILNDNHVFEKSGDEAERDIALTLLLDGSMSRINTQEIIACEAYVIARSLQAARIPVQVCAFRSIRGYTVIEVLKAFDDKKSDGILNYYAGGWNRDGLALRTMDYLLKDTAHQDWKQLLLVLTDGSPNDSMPMPALRGEMRTREYQGPQAVEDTKNAVDTLRKAGISTAAIFHGATYHLDAIHQIYGEDYVRISRLEELSDGVASLLLRQLQKRAA